MPRNSKITSELPLQILDTSNTYYGGNQYWFPNLFQRLNGCGPVAAANITAYLSKTYPEKYASLYPTSMPLNKADFIKHMIAIRHYVKPGIMGLTSIKQFANSTLTFAKQKEVLLTPHILDDKMVSLKTAVTFIQEALTQKLPVAILILKHPAKTFKDYTWHWMTITHLYYQTSDQTYYIVVSTYGERKVISFSKLWNTRHPNDPIRLVYFK